MRYLFLGRWFAAFSIRILARPMGRYDRTISQVSEGSPSRVAEGKSVFVVFPMSPIMGPRGPRPVYAYHTHSVCGVPTIWGLGIPCFLNGGSTRRRRPWRKSSQPPQSVASAAPLDVNERQSYGW